jgi:hypothetical protein
VGAGHLVVRREVEGEEALARALHQRHQLQQAADLRAVDGHHQQVGQVLVPHVDGVREDLAEHHHLRVLLLLDAVLPPLEQRDRRLRVEVVSVPAAAAAR